MKSKKVIVLLISLTLLVSMTLPGRVVVYADQAPTAAIGTSCLRTKKKTLPRRAREILTPLGRTKT